MYIRKGFMFYLNTDKVSDIDLIEKLKKENNISGLVRQLLSDHYNNVKEVTQRAGKIFIDSK